MARAIAASFLVAAGVAVVLVLVSATGAFTDVPGALLVALPIALVAAPIALGLIAAWLLPGAWPDRERPRWSAGVGIAAIAAGACGLILGGIAGLYLAFATGLFIIGY